MGMKESLKDRRPEGATEKPGLVNPKEIRVTFQNFTADQLLTISETLTAMARKKIKAG